MDPPPSSGGSPGDSDDPGGQDRCHHSSPGGNDSKLVAGAFRSRSGSQTRGSDHAEQVHEHVHTESPGPSEHFEPGTVQTESLQDNLAEIGSRQSADSLVA
jgi:hypothetical protein